MHAQADHELARARALTGELIELVAELRAQLAGAQLAHAETIVREPIRASRAGLRPGELRDAFISARRTASARVPRELAPRRGR